MFNFHQKMNSFRSLKDDFFWKRSKKKYLFIHIPKNLGISLKLNKHCLELCSNISLPMLNKDVLKNLLLGDQYTDLSNSNHARVADLKKEVINKYKIFCVIRNPWARCVSRFYYGIKLYKIFNISLPKNLTSFQRFWIADYILRASCITGLK